MVENIDEYRDWWSNFLFFFKRTFTVRVASLSRHPNPFFTSMIVMEFTHTHRCESSGFKKTSKCGNYHSYTKASLNENRQIWREVSGHYAIDYKAKVCDSVKKTSRDFYYSIFFPTCKNAIFFPFLECHSMILLLKIDSTLVLLLFWLSLYYYGLWWHCLLFWSEAGQ
jgi:hypothetical protein